MPWLNKNPLLTKSSTARREDFAGVLSFFDADRLASIKEKRAKRSEICRFAAGSGLSVHPSENETLYNEKAFYSKNAEEIPRHSLRVVVHWHLAAVVRRQIT